MGLGRELVTLVGVNLVLWIWILVVPPRCVRVRRLWPRGAMGLALPGVILLTRRGWCRAVLRHELEHQAQMRRWSPLGAALALGWHYLLRPLWRLVRHGHVPSFGDLYRTCPLEIQANAAMLPSMPMPKVLGRIPDL